MRALFLLVTIALLGACHEQAALASGVPPTTASLAHSSWQLETATDAHGQTIQALFARPGQLLELVFEEHHLSVRHTCNAIGGDYHLADGRLQLDGLIHTMMACSDPALNTLGRAIRIRLHAHPRLLLTQDGGAQRLRLLTDDGDILVFTAVPASEKP